MQNWTAVERDAISELLNLGMGQAAKALSELLQQEVLLSVPQVELLNRVDLTESVEKLTTKELVSVRQEFAGPFGGNAVLLFSDDSSLELVRALVADDLLLEDLPYLEQEAVSEVGNIVINACLSSLADALGQEIPVNLPTFGKGKPEDLLGRNSEDETAASELLVFSRIQFELKSLDIVGYLALFLCLESVNRLKRELNDLFDSTQAAE